MLSWMTQDSERLLVKGARSKNVESCLTARRLDLRTKVGGSTHMNCLGVKLTKSVF